MLIKAPFNKFLSGKFTLATKFNKNHDQFLEINLELRKDKKISSELKSELEMCTIKALTNFHSEYKELLRFVGKKAHPQLVFWPSGDPLYFKQGIKQFWVKK